MEAGEECDCGSVQVSDQCQVGTGDTEVRAREGLDGDGRGPPASLPFFPRPSGVQPSGRELLQEMHPDSRCHVQRWALLSPLQGERDPPLERAGSLTKRHPTACDLIRGGV